MKVIQVLEALITTDNKKVKITEQEFIDIIELCLGNLSYVKSVRKVYEMVKTQYELEIK
jgi:hypothetical protein